MGVNVAGLLTSLGINVTGLEAQATNYLMQQAANWARLPTRFARVDAAQRIVGSAAVQRQNPAIAAKMMAVASGLAQTRKLYDSASSTVADVVDRIRALAPGQVPPIALVPQVAQAAGAVTAVTKALTALEGQVASAAQQVLTPTQLAQLKTGGLSFPSFMGAHLTTVLKYAIFVVPLYYVLRRKRGRA